jgi:hypothetical protein
MKKLTVVLVFLLAALAVAPMLGQSPKYPPLSGYMMTPEAEIALPRSAAPENVSAHATVKTLTSSGYQVAAQGSCVSSCEDGPVLPPSRLSPYGRSRSGT